MQLEVKECSRETAKPCQGSWRKLKKMTRYLFNRESVVWDFKWQGFCGKTLVFTDIDWGEIATKGSQLAVGFGA